jgi:hypothetical protein
LSNEYLHPVEKDLFSTSTGTEYTESTRIVDLELGSIIWPIWPPQKEEKKIFYIFNGFKFFLEGWQFLLSRSLAVYFKFSEDIYPSNAISPN